VLKKLQQQLRFVFILFVLVTAVEVVNLLSNRALNQFGLVPRQLNGLLGIVTSPFLHGNVWHYFSNIVPLCVFSFLLLQYGNKTFLRLTVLLMLSTGLLVWLFARPALHVGASGVLYGYFGFLLLAGWRSAQWKPLLISVVVAVFYGGLVFGVLPTRYYVSWESHLFGFVSGLVLAWVWKFR
jgi:membrane associated rhomboid family serine protease